MGGAPDFHALWPLCRMYQHNKSGTYPQPSCAPPSATVAEAALRGGGQGAPFSRSGIKRPRSPFCVEAGWPAPAPVEERRPARRETSPVRAEDYLSLLARLEALGAEVKHLRDVVARLASPPTGGVEEKATQTEEFKETEWVPEHGPLGFELVWPGSDEEP